MNPTHRYSIFEITEGSPLIPAYGAGVDSTAMIIELVERKIPIEHILFADTGGEKPETYAYISIFSAWLRANGYPEVTRVAYRPQHDRYTTLQGSCMSNGVLPSLAYGGRSCSAKFKHEVQDAHILGKSRGLWAGAGLDCAVRARSRGVKIYRAIGYDAGPKDARRPSIPEDDHFRYVYPLQELQMDRVACIRKILSVGLPVPIKSACFFCPASKPAELIWLHAHHPDLFMQALVIEDNAQPKLTTVEGLWRKSTKTRPGSWVSWAFIEGLAQRLDNGQLRLIPHEGPLPPHPDELIARNIALEMAA